MEKFAQSELATVQFTQRQVLLACFFVSLCFHCWLTFLHMLMAYIKVQLFPFCFRRWQLQIKAGRRNRKKE